jgi:uncharacterized protein YxeA
MKKIIILLIIITAYLSGIISGVIISGTKDTIIKIEADQPLLAEAFRYHGIKEATIDSTGLIYFIRDSKWCAVYNNSFRTMIATKQRRKNEYRKHQM